MKNDERNMGIRTISGSMIILITAISALVSSYSYALFCLVVAVAIIYEIFKISEKGESAIGEGYSPQYAVGLAFAALLVLSNFAIFEFYPFDSALTMVGLSSLILLPLISSVVLFVELMRDKSKPLANSAVTLLSIIYVALPISISGAIPRLMNGGEWSGAIMLGYFFLLWSNDSFAYLFGVTMGRRPLFKRISPKKSVEGFIGGILGALFISLVAAWIVGGNFYVWGGLSIVVSLGAVFGDFVESMIKRSIGVKDSGSVIPGHGGFWDRFDSLVYSIPMAIAYLYILTVFNIC